jgi:uridine phosphorylase
MPYPNFKNKHREKALFNPIDFVKYRKFNGKFPTKYILTYQRGMERYFVKKYRPKKHELYSLLTIYVHKNIGFVRMTGIGAPNAAVILDELIALGGKTFINVGTAGGLDKEGIFICEKSLRDEGTSHHYAEYGKFSHPNKILTEKLAKTLNKNKITYERGISWTIDAPYRETKAEVEHYRKEGISTVEMESSALFSVAKYRKAKIASAFVVSDVLGRKWLPKFHRFDTKKAQRQLIDSALDCLSN